VPAPACPAYAPTAQYVLPPQGLPAPTAPVAYPVVRPAAHNPWRLRAVVEKDHPCLEMQLNVAGEDACAYCDNMTLKIGNESLKVTVADKQLHVSGSFVKGSADSVTRNTLDGSILLEGHVKVKYEKDGQKAEVSAERVLFGVADGRLEVKPVEKADRAAVFSFWTGFAR
jgi:hypothetical protein